MFDVAQDAALVGQEAQDTAEVVDPAAEHRMVQNVLDALLQDDKVPEPKVSQQHAYLLCTTPCCSQTPA